jgi:hypothetical protein
VFEDSVAGVLIRVLAVEQRTVLPWIRDVVIHVGEPLERIHRLEVAAQGGVHP